MDFFNLWDLIVILIAYLYTMLVISVGEVLRKKMGYPSSFTRKVIHLFAGFAMYTCPFYTYSHYWLATIVALTFTILLYLTGPKSPVKKLRSWFEAMAREEDYKTGHIFGPFYYALSITILVAIFSFQILPVQYMFTAAAGLTVMYWGDGLAAPIGKRWGKHQYQIFPGATRSVEGSLGVFVGGFAGALLAMWFFGPFSGLYPLVWKQILILAFTAAVTGMIVEAVSPKGIDNITLPFTVTGMVYLVSISLGIII